MKTALALALSLALSTGAAQAADRYPECEHTPSNSDVEAAKGLHRAAEQYYAKARYDKAIQSWVEAYGFDCRAHGLLINIGNAYEKLGETEKAIEAFETYVARTGEKADATIPDKIANLKELLARQKENEPPPPPAPDPLPAPAPQPKPPPDARDEGPGPYPWVMVGLGGAVAIGGAVLLGIGINNENEADEQCPDRDNCPADIADKGNEALRMQPAGGVMLGVGGAAIVGGILWYALASSSAEAASSDAALRPSVTLSPSFSGVGLAGRF